MKKNQSILKVFTVHSEIKSFVRSELSVEPAISISQSLLGFGVIFDGEAENHDKI